MDIFLQEFLFIGITCQNEWGGRVGSGEGKVGAGRSLKSLKKLEKQFSVNFLKSLLSGSKCKNYHFPLKSSVFTLYLKRMKITLPN